MGFANTDVCERCKRTGPRNVEFLDGTPIISPYCIECEENLKRLGKGNPEESKFQFWPLLGFLALLVVYFLRGWLG